MTRLRSSLLRLVALALAALLVACGGREASAPTAAPLVVDGLSIGTPANLQSYRYRVEVRSNADLIDTSQAPWRRALACDSC